MKHVPVWIAALLSAFSFANVSAQISEPSRIQALRMSEPIRVDGVLTEPVWEQAQRITNFTQRELTEGEPVTERTEVAILYDERSLYVGFWGFDRNPEELIARRMERDFEWGSEDNFELILDTYNDDRNGYLFVINPNGAKADATVADNGRTMNKDWDGVWYVATRVTNEGWFAEFQIPLSTLRFRSTREQEWGINFERNIRRKHEQVMWQGWSRDSELENVARAGTLFGLQDLTDVRLVEAKPYALGGLETRPDTERKTISDIGGDLNYLITPAVKLTVTVNPDFGQVEADRAQVNLTRFSLFYPEKREFFLEGQEFFDFTLNNNSRPFFSRRVGLDEHGSPQTILGGARVLGKFGGTTLGAMSLQTAELDDTPTTNFTVLRWKQDVLAESSVGFLAVTKIQPGRINAAYGADFHYATSHLFGDKNFAAGLSLVQSYTSDADVRTGMAHRAFLSYPSDFIEFDASWNREGSNFNPEAGFSRRQAYQEFYAELQFNPRPKFLPWIRRAEVKPLDINYYIDDETHEMQSLFTEFRPLGFATTSGEFVELNIQYLGENIVEDFEISDEVVISPDKYWFTRYEVQAESFSGRPVFGEIAVNWGGFYDGTRTEAEGTVTWRTGKYLSLSADLQKNWVSLPEGSFEVTELGGRADFAFSPRLFGSVFGQWNDEDQEALFNFRINWIPKPGTDLFLVVNQSADTWQSRWASTGTAMVTKLVWRFTF
jgi:hypothetical protein